VLSDHDVEETGLAMMKTCWPQIRSMTSKIRIQFNNTNTQLQCRQRYPTQVRTNRKHLGKGNAAKAEDKAEKKAGEKMQNVIHSCRFQGSSI
jgi:hypothetical protein